MKSRRIHKFLRKNSGRIIGVGDIFDHSRSSISGETKEAYLARTKRYWKHIRTFIHGNHDSMFLNDFDHLNSVRIYKKKNVIALHGHQLQFTFKQSRILKYEHRFYAKMHSKSSVFWDVEEWFCRKFNKYFAIHGKRAYAQGLSVLSELDKAGMLSDEIDTIIVGHTHLPFDVKVNHNGKRYRVANCGSSNHGQKFNPIFVKSINRWFVSDFHMGTNKSKLN